MQSNGDDDRTGDWERAVTAGLPANDSCPSDAVSIAMGQVEAPLTFKGDRASN